MQRVQSADARFLIYIEFFYSMRTHKIIFYFSFYLRRENAFN